MEVLNYKKVMALKPTLLDTVINQMGQKVELYECPMRGERLPVIAVIAEFKEMVYTDFFDTSDFYVGSDYNPVYMHGYIDSAFKFNL